MSYRYLGYGITDSNGEAKLEYDENGNHLDHSITGTGAGELDIVASLDNPISSGSLVSETYSIIDGVLFDTATSFDNTKWNDYGCTSTYSENGTNIKPNTDYRYQSKYDLTDGLAIEYEVFVPSTVSENPICYVRGQQPTLNASDFPRDVWNKVKFECRNLSIKIYSNGVFLYELTPQSTNSIFQFRVTNSELTFKNFVVYPI